MYILHKKCNRNMYKSEKEKRPIDRIPVCSKVKLEIEIMNGLFQKEQMQTF